MTATDVIGAVTLAVLGFLSKYGWDKARNGNGKHVPDIRAVLSEREEVSFQATMKMMVTELRDAWREGQAEQNAKLEVTTKAMQDAATAIHLVAEEVKGHRNLSNPAIQATLENQSLIKDLHAITKEIRDAVKPKRGRR